MDKKSILDGYRVLDLTNEVGHMCGMILGDMGAEVIKIEKPGGDSSRNIGPFYKGIPDPEKSLFWFATNASKMGITLDIETENGRELFKKLVTSADFVVESFMPGYLDQLGLGYAELESIKPDLIMTSITPFGQTGPYSHHMATDLTVSAMGGLARILGDLGRPPVRMGCPPQAYFQACLHASIGTMVAHYHRTVTGEGQHVDVSMQQAVTLGIYNAVDIYEAMGVNIMGMGQFLISARPEPHGVLFTRLVFPCKDGFVICVFGGGGSKGVVRSSTALINWANEEGHAMEFKGFDFSKWDSVTLTQEKSDGYFEIIGNFFKTKTKSEIYERAVRHGIMIAPCNTTEDLPENIQLKAREYWLEVDHDELGVKITYPGPPVKMDNLEWKTRHRAPLIGEHNESIYKNELGISDERLAILKGRNII